MDIEAIEALVKKYSEDAPECSYDFNRSEAEVMLRAALTELAAEYEAVAQVTKMNSDRLLRKANERIHQLEAERVPDGWRIERDDDAIIVTKLGIGGCVVNRVPTAAREIPESILWELADSMLAAAPQQKKEPHHD